MKTTGAQPSHPAAEIASPTAPLDRYAPSVSGGTWATCPVTEQPSLTLTQWQVLQLPSGERHFAGWAVQNREGRASSAIQIFDAANLRGITRSRRVYQLQGAPGCDDDAEHVWRTWARINSQPEWVDVSAAVWASHLEAGRTGNPTAGPATP